ncbi:MAG: DegT/DnrJ/EryC1/StrS aminotransferase family protein [Treponemataceae bacterium]|nr:DegT/DnrJ/EryC1/StrS aminotransferase family protein [Treponemataceae bacterium]
MAERIPSVPFSRPSISRAEEDAVLAVLRSGWLTTGTQTLQFEQEFSAFMNGCDTPDVKNARAAAGLDAGAVASLAVNSNTSGMMLAMEACGVAPGTAVVTTPYTFASTAMCARHLGADVVFADISADGYNIDPERVAGLLAADTERRIKAVVPVHIAGVVCDMERLCALGAQYGVKIIEDAAHSFPSPTALGAAGAIADAGVFSFYATKTITTAEGGMVCTRSPGIARRMATMRMHGMDRTAWDRYTSPRASWEYDIVAPGWKCNLPDILSAIGRCQLKRAWEFCVRRTRIAQLYNKAFSELDFVRVPPDGAGNAWHLYLLRLVPERLRISRRRFAELLQERGIGISMHFIPLFHFTYWKELYPDFRAERFPRAEEAYSATITLPLWPDMTDSMAAQVVEAVAHIGREHHA